MFIQVKPAVLITALKEKAMFRKTLCLAALTTLFTGSLLVAQQSAPDTTQAPASGASHHHRHHAPDPNKQTAHLTKALNLTSDQASKVEPILADRDQKMAALQADTTLSPKDMHKQMRAIHMGTEQQLEGVLTPDQVQQMKSMHHRGHRGPQDQAPPAPGV